MPQIPGRAEHLTSTSTRWAGFGGAERYGASRILANGRRTALERIPRSADAGLRFQERRTELALGTPGKINIRPGRPVRDLGDFRAKPSCVTSPWCRRRHTLASGCSEGTSSQIRSAVNWLRSNGWMASNASGSSARGRRHTAEQLGFRRRCARWPPGIDRHYGNVSRTSGR
jgi:hypothetical protein